MISIKKRATLFGVQLIVEKKVICYLDKDSVIRRRFIEKPEEISLSKEELVSLIMQPNEISIFF